MPKISELPTDTAPDVADTIPFVDVTASRTEAVTVDNLAASAAFSSRYEPLGALLQSTAHCTAWRPVSGSPVLSDSSAGASGQRHTVMLYDGSALETCYVYMPLPVVTEIDVWLEWVNPSATAGDAVWQAQYEFMAPSGTLDLYVTGSQITITSPAQNVITETRLVSALAIGSSTSIGLKLLRRGDVAGDTIDAVDLGAIAVHIREAA